MAYIPSISGTLSNTGMHRHKTEPIFIHDRTVFWAPINSLVAWFYVSALGLVLLQIVTSQRPTSIDSLSHPFLVLSRSCSSTQQAMLGCTPLQLDFSFAPELLLHHPSSGCCTRNLCTFLCMPTHVLLHIQTLLGVPVTVINHQMGFILFKSKDTAY